MPSAAVRKHRKAHPVRDIYAYRFVYSDQESLGGGTVILKCCWWPISERVYFFKVDVIHEQML